MTKMLAMVNSARMRWFQAVGGEQRRTYRIGDAKPRTASRLGYPLAQSRRVAGMRRADLATPHDCNGSASFYRRVYRRYFNAACVQRFVSLATAQVLIDRRRMRSCPVRPGL